eukprot:1137313-Pelagomonas_calceolata.AAC.2
MDVDVKESAEIFHELAECTMGNKQQQQAMRACTAQTTHEQHCAGAALLIFDVSMDLVQQTLQPSSSPISMMVSVTGWAK